MGLEKRPFAEEKKISSIIISWSGVFDFDGLYTFIQTWLANREYEFHEKQYKQKPEAEKIGEHIELKWFGEKKITGYFMDRIDVHMHLWNIETVEAEGKKLTSARMWINLSSTLILDYEQKWGKSKFYSFLRDFVHNHVIKKEIDLKWGEDLRLELNKFLEDIKAYLGAMARGKVY